MPGKFLSAPARVSLRFRLLFALALAPSLFGGRALAWEKEIHRSIAEAALRVSPAAETRLPVQFRDAFFQEAAEADYLDKECRYHPSAPGDREPALQAEKLFVDLMNPKKYERPYARAQALGRFVHFVADSMVLGSVKAEGAAKTLNFFANKNFILFREKRSLSAPLAAALRERAATALWGGSEDSERSMFFRQVVNLVDDALCLLPPRADAEKKEDAGPIIFVVNRMDNGTAAAARSGGWTETRKTVIDDIPSSPRSYMTGTSTQYDWTYEGAHGGGASVKKPNMMEIPGLQILEMTVRARPEGSRMKVLLFNNASHCAVEVALKIGSWTWRLPEKTMPPMSLRMVEVPLPANLTSKRLTSSSVIDSCEGKLETQEFLSAGRKLVVGNTGAPPRFEGVVEELNLSDAGAKSAGISFNSR